MQYDAIFFDMDGTLLPMDTDAFTTGYFKLLLKALSPFKPDPQQTIAAIWHGTKAMMVNDGSRTNCDAFWQVFCQETGLDREKTEPICDTFYGEGFHAARTFTSPNSLAAEAVRVAHEKADTVVLATNPLFPMPGQVTRMSWVGLRPEDFALVTAYETQRFAKPNPAYYTEICNQLGLVPQRCLMIGNDEYEDGYAAAKAGMDVYLVTDCLLKNEKHPWNGPSGTFREMLEMLKQL